MLVFIVLLCGCQKSENIDYDNSLWEFDEAMTWNGDRAYTFGFYHDSSTLSSEGTTWVFDEDSIHKGYFYILKPGLRYKDKNVTVDDAVVKAVYTLDYMVDGETIRFHTFTMSFEEINCKFHDITLSTSWSNVIELEISEDNIIEQTLDHAVQDSDGSIFQTDYWIKGTVTYEGQEYKFSQQF